MDRLVKYTTIIYALIWFLGFVISDSFYSIFNINIIEYLDFSEVVFIFLSTVLNKSNIIDIIVIFLTNIIGLYVMYNLVKKSNKKLFVLLLVIYSLPLAMILGIIFKFLEIYIKINLPFSINYILVLLVFLLTLKMYSPLTERQTIQLSRLISKPITNGLKSLSFYLSKTNWFYYLTITAFITTAYSLYRLQIFNASQIKNDSPINVSFIYKEANNVITDSTLLYLGSTRNFIFLYDKKRDNSKVFERSNISNLEIHKSQCKVQ